MNLKSKSVFMTGVFICVVVLLVTAVLAASSETPEIVETGDVSAGAPGLAASLYVNGLDDPVAIAHAYDGRLFVAERAGQVRVIDSGGNLLATPFLNISSLVLDNPNERGLLGLAFHPNYPATPYFYVNYTDLNGDTVVARYQVSAGDENIADPNSGTTILTIDQPEWNHNGGDLKFGPRDGYLYISTGDGGGSGDPGNNGQSGSTLLGKILRIDVDGGSPYAIPSDNPFVGNASVRDEIWSLGLRNPWRISFDRLNGDLYIGDVGQGAWEEVNYQHHTSDGGENYGWRCYEGTHPYNTNGCQPASAYVMPFFDYDHPTGFAVTGGFVYRGSSYPTLQGWYIFADYATSRFWVAQQGESAWDVQELGNIGMNGPSTFGESCNGELYVASLGGSIYRIGPSTGTTVVGNSDAYIPLIVYDVTPSPTATNTPQPTDTPEPTATNTPEPTATNTPTPLPTLPPLTCGS